MASEGLVRLIAFLVKHKKITKQYFYQAKLGIAAARRFYGKIESPYVVLDDSDEQTRS